jgi:hypothetical protein
MSLQLNLPSEGQRLEECFGPNTVQMPVVLRDGGLPWTLKDLMERRLLVRTSDFGKDDDPRDVAAVYFATWHNYFDVLAWAIYGMKGHNADKVKLVTGPQALALARQLTPRSDDLVGRALALGRDRDEAIAAYEAIEGQGVSEFLRNELEWDRFATVWRSFAEGDDTLVREYRIATNVEVRRKEPSYTGDVMFVALANPQEVTTGRLWCVCRSSSYSNADGISSLGDSGGRLVRVAAPEAQLEAGVA